MVSAVAIAPWHDNYIPEPNSGCWLWLGMLDSDGYGISHPAGCAAKAHKVHRLFYEWLIGPIPNGLCVCHRCDVGCCCNPEHLFLGTSGDNNRDRKSKGRYASISGEKCATALLTMEQVAQIRSSTKKQKELAGIYGVSQQTISTIKCGKVYRQP